MWHAHKTMEIDDDGWMNGWDGMIDGMMMMRANIPGRTIHSPIIIKYSKSCSVLYIYDTTSMEDVSNIIILNIKYSSFCNIEFWKVLSMLWSHDLDAGGVLTDRPGSTGCCRWCHPPHTQGCRSGDSRTFCRLLCTRRRELGPPYCHRHQLLLGDSCRVKNVKNDTTKQEKETEDKLSPIHVTIKNLSPSISRWHHVSQLFYCAWSFYCEDQTGFTITVTIPSAADWRGGLSGTH